jgi:hypothetical protein
VTRRVKVNAPEPEVPEWRWAVREAAGLVAALRGSLLDPNWAALWLARRRILRAVHLLGDVRLAGLAAGLEAAAAELRQSEPEAAGRRLASVANGLADVLESVPGGGGSPPSPAAVHRHGTPPAFLPSRAARRC